MGSRDYVQRPDTTSSSSAPARWQTSRQNGNPLPNEAFRFSRPFVVPKVQPSPEETEQTGLEASKFQGASLLSANLKTSIDPNYVPPWVARAQAASAVQLESEEGEESSEAREESLQRSLDGSPPEDPDGQVQRSAAGVAQAQPDLEGQLGASKGRGSPLPEDVRSFMEPRFGADFSGVRVHTGGDAVQMNRSVGAKAFAHGSDIYYGSGNTPGNDALTAHELTHTIQQTGRSNIQRQTKHHDRTKKRIVQSQPMQHDTNASNLDAKSAQPEQNQPATVAAKESINQTHNEALDSFQVKDVKTVDKPVKNNVVAFSTKGASLPENSSQNLVAVPEAKSSVDPGVIAAPQQVSETVSAQTAGAASGQSAIPTGGGAAPSIESSGDSAEEAAGAETTEDPALAAISQKTEGIELPEEAKAEVGADLQEIGAGGGEAPASMGGGGGGSAIADKPIPPAPDISQAEDPAQALATVANLPPTQLQVALGSVRAVVDKSVNKEKAETANNPPQMEVGAEGVTGSVTDKTPPAGAAPKAVEKAPAGQPKPTPAPKPLPNLPALVKAALTPTVQGDAGGKLSGQDVQNLKASLRQLPTKDPAAKNLKAKAAPPLKLEGDANPQQAKAQRTKLAKSVDETYAQGQKDVAQPLGEDQIKATVPKEMLKAEPSDQGAGSTGGGLPKGGQAGGEAETDDAIGIIAQEKHGATIQVAVAQAQGQMATERQGHQARVTQEKQKSQEEINKLQTENTNEQQQEKLKAKTEADQLRSDWTKEQNQSIQKANQEADAEISKGDQAIQTEHTQAEQKACQEIDSGNEKAETERQKGEEQAEAERQKGEKESGGGFFGWMASRAKAFFEGIKKAVQHAFEAARAAMKAAIEAAQKLATAAIEAGRKAIVGIIRRVGDVLIALGDRLLASFPQLRDRFRKLIQDKVKQAEAAVNRIAENLKKNVKAALNLLAKGLDAALGLLQKGLMAAVDIASGVVQGAISMAKAAVEALGTFAVLIKDIVANPGQWISNLVAGVMDGIKNHLWTAFKAAMQEWFNQKLEEVLGLGMTVWNLLKQGGFNLVEVGKMAWEGIKAAIPSLLIQIVIEQVANLIIPGLGAVMAIINSLQAAWGTVSRIIQAMERFVGFLKAVKSGASGPLFGQLLAAAGVVLVDFVSNFLLRKVRGAASKVAGKIKAIAQKIGNKLKGAFAKVKTGAGKLKDRFFGGKGSKDGKPSGKKNKSPEDKKKEDLEKKQKKVDRAVSIATKLVNQLAGRQIGRQTINPILAGIKRLYSLQILEATPQGKKWIIYGKINPDCQQETKEIGNDIENTSNSNKSEQEAELPKYKTPHQPLSSEQAKVLKQKMLDRTLTREEYERLRWHNRFANRRARGVSRFWSEERQRLKSGGQGTRDWTPEQTEALLKGKVPQHQGKPMEGHHRYNALDHPQLADNPAYIYPVTKNEHFNRWHGGNWQNDTIGKPLNDLHPEDF